MKLARHEYGYETAAPFRCRAPECQHHVITTGGGHSLPFCLVHCEKLSRKLFQALVDVAHFSPFDTLGVGLTERATLAALRYLMGARRQG